MHSLKGFSEHVTNESVEYYYMRDVIKHGFDYHFAFKELVDKGDQVSTQEDVKLYKAVLNNLGIFRALPFVKGDEALQTCNCFHVKALCEQILEAVSTADATMQSKSAHILKALREELAQHHDPASFPSGVDDSTLVF
jgi:hypothetical protein